MLAEIDLLTDTLEGYLWDTAYRIQNDPKFDTVKSPYSRIFSRDNLTRVILLALDVMGGVNIMRDHPLEKLIRDGLTFLHASGTNSLTKLKVATALL